MKLIKEVTENKTYTVTSTERDPILYNETRSSNLTTALTEAFNLPLKEKKTAGVLERVSLKSEDKKTEIVFSLDAINNLNNSFSDKDSKLLILCIKKFSMKNEYRVSESEKINREFEISLDEYIELIEGKNNSLNNRKKYSSIMNKHIEKLTTCQIKGNNFFWYENKGKKKREKHPVKAFINVFDSGIYSLSNGSFKFGETFAQCLNTNQSLYMPDTVFNYSGLPLKVYLLLIHHGGMKSNISKKTANRIAFTTICERCALPNKEERKRQKTGYDKAVKIPVLEAVAILEGDQDPSKRVISSEWQNKRGEAIDPDSITEDNESDVYLYFSMLDHPIQPSILKGETKRLR